MVRWGLRGPGTSRFLALPLRSSESGVAGPIATIDSGVGLLAIERCSRVGSFRLVGMVAAVGGFGVADGSAGRD